MSTTTKTELVRLGIDFDLVESDPSTTCVLNPQLHFVYCNLAWDAFASKNGGETVLRQAVIGTSILDATPAILVDFFADAFAQVQSQKGIWEHDYECSSARQYRLFRMRVLPLRERHLLIEHSLRVELPHEPAAIDGAMSRYQSQDSTVTMCCHCRRVLRTPNTSQSAWDFIPRLVERPPRLISHGLCSNCRTHYYDDP